ncbi:MAG: hypothetical protein NOF05_14510 [Candidatus Accumulibacter phosphatis]|uniref:hypothetical protein n=1 Tax=Accumulibacter sp. TaxID=2053492 RepID=UPI000625853C|nr:hypothetical protein [Accumulibacter sp.]MCM8622760.1 hypothetical protein [Accumulibacter sp.]MCQ1549993.1 hypothetical protein [Candidatus Accumulibacter phosphatis]
MKLVIIPLLSSLILATIFGSRVLFRQRAVFIVDGVRDFPPNDAGSRWVSHTSPFCLELRR